MEPRSPVPAEALRAQLGLGAQLVSFWFIWTTFSEGREQQRREGQGEIFHPWVTPQTLQELGLGQAAARSQELRQGPHEGGGALCCLPGGS